MPNDAWQILCSYKTTVTVILDVSSHLAKVPWRLVGTLRTKVYFVYLSVLSFLLHFAAPNWGFVQPFVAVFTVSLHGDCTRFNRRRPAERLPVARHGKWQDRDSTTGDCVVGHTWRFSHPLRNSWPNMTRGSKTVFVLQFFAWFAKLQNNMDRDENVKYR